jgi:enoyl-[acyl-carrier protein] reductase II
MLFENFKNYMVQANFNSTFLRMKKLVPVRLLENQFSKAIEEAENNCASKDDLKAILGKGRAKEGMLMGNIEQGELEVGQIVSEVKEILTCAQLVEKLKHEYIAASQRMLSCSSFI